MARGPASFAQVLTRSAGVLALLCALPPQALAQPSDLAVKAAFLTKFPAYLDWPAAGRPGAGAPFSICVVGTDPFGRLLDSAASGQQVGGHPIRLRRHAGAAGTGGCQIAFVQGTGAVGTAALLQGLTGKPILTVTDGRAGPQQGMIHFTVQQGRVRFTIDQAAAQRSRLEINSRLLAIAVSVKRGR